jgi:hypothetical protein
MDEILREPKPGAPGELLTGFELRHQLQDRQGFAFSVLAALLAAPMSCLNNGTFCCSA